jgi:hypothetical protein
VLKAAAEGAKVGFADLTTVADALTTAMTDYHLPPASDRDDQRAHRHGVARQDRPRVAVGVAVEGRPVAHAAGIGLDETLGAMSTMTAQGTNAAKAATYLAQTIKSLSAPTQKSTKELDAIGLSARTCRRTSASAAWPTPST